MKNLNPRTILWMVFASSIFLLWSNYQQHIMPKQTAAQQSASPNTSVGTANGAPNTASNGTSGSTPATNSLSLTGTPVLLENDVLKLNINTQGGVVQFAMLKKYFNSHNKALNTVVAEPDIRAKLLQANQSTDNRRN